MKIRNNNPMRRSANGPISAKAIKGVKVYSKRFADELNLNNKKSRGFENTIRYMTTDPGKGSNTGNIVPEMFEISADQA